MARDSLWRRRRGAPAGWVRSQRRCLLPQAKGTQACVAASRSPPQLRRQRPPGPRRRGEAGGLCRRGRYSWSIASPACSHSSPRRSRLVRFLRSCRRHARSASSSSRYACRSPWCADASSTSSLRSCSRSTRIRSVAYPDDAGLPAGGARARALGYRLRAGSGGFGLERGGRERLTGLALRRARAAREHLGHHVVRLVVLVPRAARGVPLHPWGGEPRRPRGITFPRSRVSSTRAEKGMDRADGRAARHRDHTAHPNAPVRRYLHSCWAARP